MLEQFEQNPKGTAVYIFGCEPSLQWLNHLSSTTWAVCSHVLSLCSGCVCAQALIHLVEVV